MKEGRIRPSLTHDQTLHRNHTPRRNEGGSNSTLVAPGRSSSAPADTCRNEGGSNSTLVVQDFNVYLTNLNAPQ